MDLMIHGIKVITGPCYNVRNDTPYLSVVLTESLFDDFVGEGASASLELAISALVNELTHRFEVGISPGDVRISDSQHAQRSLVQLDKSGVVDLTETEQLKNLNMEK